MKNFDYTQFITFDSNLPHCILYPQIKELFGELGFEVTTYDNMDTGKKEYYQDYWKQHTYELTNDFFLDTCADWDEQKAVPEEIEKFLCKFNLLCRMDIENICLIICQFAEKGTTEDEVVFTTKEGIADELFKMSIYSCICPNNLIINITDI